MTVGERIKKRRSELGLTVDEVAEKLNKNRATIYRYESNAIENMPFSVLEPLAEVLDVSMSYLMGWEDKKPIYGKEYGQYDQLGENMAWQRKKANLTQEQMSEYLSVTTDTIRDVENGKTRLNDNLMKRFCELVNCDLSDLNYPGWLYGIDRPELEEIPSSQTDNDCILEIYRSLNSAGKNKVKEYAVDLAANPKYKKK